MVPSRRGHFRLESGYHTDTWLTLDALFTDPAAIAPDVRALAARLHAYQPSAICGPFVGGAFLAHLLATTMGLKFFYAELAPKSRESGLFTARYTLPPELQRRIRGERVAVVDEMISAGSSVRATIESVTAAGGSVCAVGTLVLLGAVGEDHFTRVGTPIESLGREVLTTWMPAQCPMCADGTPIDTL